MPAQPLILYPDARLRAPAEPVTAWNEGLRILAADVLDTLCAVSAIGLTAPHIGRLSRLVVIRLQPDLAPVTYVNPQIVWASPERGPQIEGSVSMPGIAEPVERAMRVRLRYRDLDGGEQEEEADGFLAACLQHEIDQLDGIFWIDRLTRLRRERALKRFAKLRRATSWVLSRGLGPHHGGRDRSPLTKSSMPEGAFRLEPDSGGRPMARVPRR